MYDVWCLDYGKDGKDGKYGNGLALCARWGFSTDHADLYSGRCAQNLSKIYFKILESFFLFSLFFLTQIARIARIFFG